jgi:phosphoglycerate dehydrogenase-like enzyme
LQFYSPFYHILSPSIVGEDKLYSMNENSWVGLDNNRNNFSFSMSICTSRSEKVMGTRHVIQQHIHALFILFKHWFYMIINLINGGLPLKDLSSETVLITGAASGLGKGVAQRLANLGCTLVLWDVDEANNTRVAEELNKATNSKRIHAMKCDLTNREIIYECAKKVD